MHGDNVQAYLDRARGDERAAAILLQNDGPEWTIGFHCQQAVEKFLKAVLIHVGINPPRTHDIVLLRELCRQSGRPLPVDLADVERPLRHAVPQLDAVTGQTHTHFMDSPPTPAFQCVVTDSKGKE